MNEWGKQRRKERKKEGRKVAGAGGWKDRQTDRQIDQSSGSLERAFNRKEKTKPAYKRILKVLFTAPVLLRDLERINEPQHEREEDRQREGGSILRGG